MVALVLAVTSPFESRLAGRATGSVPRLSDAATLIEGLLGKPVFRPDVVDEAWENAAQAAFSGTFGLAGRVLVLS